jgi:hypothetical protein
MTPSSTMATGDFLLAEAKIGPQHQKFPALAGCTVRQVLASGIGWPPGIAGHYCASVSIRDENLDSWRLFVAPDDEIVGHPPAGTKTVTEAFSVFDTADAALSALSPWIGEPDAHALSVLRLQDEDGTLVATEVLRIAVTPSENAIGPILYEEEDIAERVHAWLKRVTTPTARKARSDVSDAVDSAPDSSSPSDPGLASYDKALQLRVEALALLEQAAALDGLQPFSVTHRHEYGASTYLLWAAEPPDENDAARVLDVDFEPDKDEELHVETQFTLEELVGVAVTTRLADLLEQEPNDSPMP